MSERLILVEVEPQPSFIESSGRWSWPLSPPHDNEGRCPAVYDASRSWWEYVPDGARPYPGAAAAYLGTLDGGMWYWVVPEVAPEAFRKAVERESMEETRRKFQASEKARGRLEHEACEVAQRLGVSLSTDPLHKGILEAIGDKEAEREALRKALELAEAIDSLKATLRDADAEKDAAMRAFHSRTVPPWTRTGIPGSEPPKDDPDALAIVKREDGPTWELVRCGGKRFEDPYGYDVEVLEYWPLPPADEGWERVWRRKP